MGRRRKHYRKIKQFHLEGRSPSPEQPIHHQNPTVRKEERSLIKRDLLTTSVIILALVVILVISSTINGKTHWTISLGTQLYEILHIR